MLVEGLTLLLLAPHAKRGAFIAEEEARIAGRRIGGGGEKQQPRKRRRKEVFVSFLRPPLCLFFGKKK